MKKLSLLFVLITALMCGCSSAAETAETKEEEVYAVTINDEGVTKEEFNIYLYETQVSFEELGGEDIWETDFDGRTAEAVAKDNTLSTITLVKISAQKAESSGISLTEEEEAQAAEDAQAMYDSLTDEEREMIGADIELYTAVFMDNALYNKMYEETVSNYVVNSATFEEYYNTYYDTLVEQYMENVSAEEPIDEEAVRDYSMANFETFRKQNYFSNEYDKWESTAKIITNDDVWNEITLIK